MAEFMALSGVLGAGESCGLVRHTRLVPKSKAVCGALGGTRTPNPFLRTELLFH